ncbi:YncE family protein [Krasilnikovia sp. M28-CT-15]|uniref:YncE family protein n=1 Tax=Krasilnikovia sp. M28-CT-15 TaxID=3373540 RepID=UPI003875F38E
MVDSVHQHLYVTGGKNVATLKVTNLAGAAQATVPGLAGATGLALSADAATLYVALASGDAIAAVDTATLTVADTYPTGATSCPTNLALDGTALYFGYGCSTWSGAIGKLALDGTRTVTKGLATSLYAAPVVVAGGGRLVASERGISSATIRLFDTSGGGLTPVITRSDSSVCGSLNDLRLTPDAGRVLVACGSPYRHTALSTVDLANAFVYTSVAYPTAVAVAPDGTKIVAGSDGYYDPDIFVSKADGTALRTYDFPTQDHLVAGGLRATSDGTVYAVTKTFSPEAYTLHVLPGATLLPNTFTLSAPGSAARGARVTLTGTLSAGSGKTVTVTKRDLTGTHTLPAVTTTDAGAFTVSDTPAVGGSNTYTLSFAGDSVYTAASKAATVSVSRAATALSVTTNATSYAYGAKATVTARLGRTYDSRKVCFTATPAQGARVSIRCATANDAGVATATWTMTRRTTFTATFAGDQRYAPVTATRAVSGAVKLEQVMDGYYKTVDGYRLYRTSVRPVLVVRVSPNRAGACVSYSLQAYRDGKWRNLDATGCHHLDGDSLNAVQLGGSRPTGVKYRMRAKFVGDSVNTGVTGKWQKFRFTK